MKTKGTTAFVIAGLLLCTSCSSSEDPVVAGGFKLASTFSVSGVDKKIYSLLSAEAKKAVEANSMPVRGEQPDLRGIKIPAVMLTPVTPSGAKALLSMRFSSMVGASPTIQDAGDVWMARQGAVVMWIDKTSGSWSFGNAVRKGAGIQPIDNAQQAVDVALRHLSRQGLLSLAAGESLDILGVRRTNGVMVDKSTGKQVLVSYAGRAPAKVHAVEYTAIFGRRFLGVPVIGSRTQVRMSPEGKLLGIRVHARPIQSQSAQPVSFQDTTVSFSTRLQAAAQVQGLPKGVVENSKACGFVEGPSGNRQTEFLPGCAVRVRVPGHKVMSPIYVPLSATGSLRGTRP